jgi:cell wall-associated NlpC family hydrolase
VRALLLPLVAALALGGCATAGRVARPQPGGAGVAPPVAVTPADAAPSAAAAPLEFARSLVGAPYLAGGASPAGFDCSGFVQYVFGQSGIALPRGVGGQFDAGRPVEAGDLRPGDLVFFAIDGRTISHVGIYQGADTFVHAPSTNGRVRVEHLSMDYWRTRFAGARRIVAAG